jgi:hypothetical protein
LSPSSKHLVRFALLCSFVAVLAPLHAQAATARRVANAPCWKLLLNDWYDGTINNTYPIPCYAAAIKHLPASASIYGSAKEDILRAEQNAIAHKPPPRETSTPGSTTTVAAGSSSGGVSSFPTPILILGGLAILLVIAGGIGMLWQRRHPRDDDGTPA